MAKVINYELGKPYKVKTNVTAGTPVSATAITLLNSVLVPANTFTAGDIITMEGMVSKSSVLSSYNPYFYWNTTNSLTGAIQIGVSTPLVGGTRSFIFYRRGLIRVANGTGLGTLVSRSTTAITGDQSVVNGASSTLGINWTIDGYFIIAASHLNSGETVTGEWVKISLF
jgi:hypothetical protein